MKIQVQNVSKSFNQGADKLSILKNVSLTLDHGHTLSIQGSSGSGKTTLLSLLAGLDRADNGDVFLGETNLSRLSEQALSAFRSQNIGIIFQQFHLMPTLSALENVSLPLEIQKKPNAEKLAREALQDVGLEDRQHHCPWQLSGGECQRVAIARALVGKPQLLIADEPSGNLDTETGQRVMNLLFDKIKRDQMTFILVTHDSELAKKCEQQLFLKNGQLQ